ncbi:hypothetical protein L1987_09007 [Smallanthus sonchifolius]|uniref:Uncharacterized protein n=1 Tax=Smallanthus sonchifolius TaxID=185202 RepID=A0ACB9JLT3_9ASTR|nr:hypothetical protein L1987_09007 [Smallanthus sonchifolius]
MSSANPEPAPLHPVVSDDKDIQEEPDQVSESKPEEESKEEPVGDAEGANSDTDSGETVTYSAMHREDTSSEEVRPPTPCPPWSPSPVPVCSEWVNFMRLARHRTARKTVLSPKKRTLSSIDAKPLPKRHCLLNQLDIGMSFHEIMPRDLGPTEHTRPPSFGMTEPQPDPEAQLSEDASEDSDAIREALDDRLVQLQGEVGLHDLAVGRLHERVTAGETGLAAVEHEVIAAGQRDERAGESLDSFAALTIVNTMLLAFFLFRGWFS